MATAGKGTSVEDRGEIPQNSSSKFKKRGGTTDAGRDYEHLYIANLILKLINDGNVQNFYLSSNDSAYGSFDDVVVEIIFKDRTETFAIQLKHVSRTGGMQIEQLNASSGNFSVEKYYKGFKKEPKLSERPTKMVLFTNSKLNDEHIDRFKFGTLTPCKQDGLLSTRNSELGGECYRFEENEDKFEEYGSFFKNLYLYTGQTDAKELETCTFEMFKAYFGSNETVFREYLHFITHWSMKEGNKFKLNKMWMKYMISLCVFSSSIKPLSFAAGRTVNAKRKIFKEAVSKFDLTLINKHNFEKIAPVWSNAVDDIDDMAETIKVNYKYQLINNGIETKDSLYDKDPTKVSKLMWLLGKSPLVVEGCPQVYQTIKICQVQNLIILDNQETFNECVGKSKTDPRHDSTDGQQKLYLFGKLSDLKKHVQLYEEILKNFTYSLQGQKDVAMKYLLEICQDSGNFISTDDLVEMTEAPLLIGKYKDVLPPSHVERKLAKVLIEVKFLQNINENTIVLVDCATDVNSFKQFLPNLVISEVNDVVIFSPQFMIERYMFFGKEVSQEEFSALCKKKSEVHFHHFRYLDNHRLEWLESGNYGPEQKFINELKTFRLQSEFTVYTIGEGQYFNHSRQNINIICADAGMGKSTLAKSLKNSSKSTYWIIIIYARNHALHFRKQGSNLENFLKYVLEDTSRECRNQFHQRVFEKMLEQNQIQLIWDGLDEATDTTQISILTLVNVFSEKGVKQWLTSRTNLKDILENELGTFARNIQQFSEDEQKEYIKNRLQIADKELNDTFNKIKKNVMSFPNYEILGIALQIYMLTELFLKDKDKYLPLLDGIFTVLDLYEHFIDEKFHVLYNDKNEITLRNEQNIQNFETEKNARMNHYKSLAATYYLYNSLTYKIVNKLFSNDKTTDRFVKKIKNEGDDVGFISRVISKYDVEFIHNSYGEYFAALYLFEHKPSKVRDRKFISKTRCKNIRFFLDLMLARNSKYLVGVIYKNLTILEECIHADLRQKDVIGRDVLEVACAWNKSYRLVENNIILNDKSFNTEWLINNKDKVVGTLNYRDIAPKFYKFSSTGHVCFKKLMIFLPFLIPLYDGNEFDEEYLVAVLYYAIRFDCPTIYECIENSVPLKTTYNNIRSRSILALALFNRSAKILKKVLSEQRNHSEWDCVEELLILDSEIDEILSFALQFPEFRIDVPNSKGQSLAHYALEKNLTKTLRSLILREVNTNYKDRNGKRPIHIALEKGHLDFFKHIAQIDVLDKDGRLPLHYACEDGDLGIIEILLANGAKVDVPDGNRQLPIHYALRKWHTVIIDVLIRNGAKVDVPDASGRLPIHYACEHGSLTMVEFMAKKGATFDAPDRGGQLALHYACRNDRWGYEIILFLFKKGVKVDVPDGNGRLPLHYACKHGHLAVVEILLKNGAQVDVPDENGRLPIHYACDYQDLAVDEIPQNNTAKVNLPDGNHQLPTPYAFKKWHKAIIEVLIKNGAKVDVPDGNGRLPIHYACENESLKTVELLATHGAKLDVPDGIGQLPIHCAFEKWNTDIIIVLVKNGAKVDVPHLKGWLPIHYACEKGRLNMVELLAMNGAKFVVPDTDGQLPMHYACRNDRWGYEIILFLFKEGVKVDVPDRDGRLPIHYACEHGNLNTVELLATNGAKFNVPDKDGQLPMHYACRNHRKGYEIILFLLEKDVEVDVPGGDERLPIHYACEHGSITMVELLATKGAKLDLPDRGGQLPMHYACRNNRWGYEIILFLCKNGMKVDVSDGDGRLPIHYAFQKFDTDIIALLVKYGAKVDIPDGDGRLPIHYACERGRLNMVELLATNGAKLNIPDGNGRLPIHYAFQKFDIDIIILLVKYGAKVDVPDGDGRLPIHYACEDGSLTMVELLATNGAKYDVPDRRGQLPIHYACKNNRWGYEIILFLCKNGVKVDVPDGDGQLPIHYAFKKFDTDIIIPLLKNGAKVDVPDENGRLPMHYACEKGRLSMIKLLALNGAKFDVPDRSGQLPMHYASRNRWWGYEIILFLCGKGVKVDVPDGDGRLPMHYACEKGRLNMVELLATNGAKFDVSDRGGQLPMHYASRNLWGGYEIILFLCKKSVKVDVPDIDGRLPIHCACAQGRLSIVELLGTNGAKFDVPDRGGQLPMHYVTTNFLEGYQIILFLCKKGVKVDVPDGDGRLPIHCACEEGRLSIVELLATNGAKYDVPDRGGQLPIHYACRNCINGDDIIFFLCKKGVKVDVPDGDGRLPIHYACEQGSLTMVELLATNGAKFDIPDRNGQLPMHYATKNIFLRDQIILFLCKKGVKVDEPDGDGRLPIHHACEHGSLTMVKLLATNGAKFNVPDRGGQLPIHSACRNRWRGYEITFFLCKSGVKVDVLDRDGRLPIHHVCERGSLHMVQLLATNGTKFDVPDKCGQLPMHYACRNGQSGYKIILFLCKNGVKVDVPDGDGRLPIHYACEHGSLTMVELLATKKAKFDVPDRGGQLPMHYACRNNLWGYEIILFLFKKCMKVDIPDGDGRLPIHYACENGRLTMVELLATNGAKLDVPDRGGQLPVQNPRRNHWGGYEKIIFLCKNGAKLDVRDEDGRLPIHYACEHGDLNTVELLVKMMNTVKLDVPDRSGQLPMHYACRNGRKAYDIILFLCKKGAKVDVPEEDGRLPIHYACEHGKLNTVELLATKGAKFDVPDSGGQLPMHYASRNRCGGYEIISFLCKNGAKVDVLDGDGRLPIHYACESGNLEMIKLLATNGAAFDVPDKCDQLPIHYACRNRWEGYKIIFFLCKKGAEVNVPDGDRRLPIHHACEHGTLDIVKLLASNGAKVYVPDQSGKLPIDYARKNRNFDSEIRIFLLKCMKRKIAHET
ncbi:uncharacterized protein LOC135142586 isoform X2 [Zophobas morio]|uniref:uncharacterized protein LOC135142586 isoform X2 n=1 Tax=Zophobas morio TaxID=2755281 RepID=UPI0030827DC1